VADARDAEPVVGAVRIGRTGGPAGARPARVSVAALLLTWRTMAGAVARRRRCRNPVRATHRAALSGRVGARGA